LIFTRRDKPNMQILYPRLRKNLLSVMGYITEILISSNRIDQKNLFTMRNSYRRFSSRNDPKHRIVTEREWWAR